MANLAFRPKTADDDQWIVDLRNRLNDHLPPGTLESFRHWERVDAKAEHAHVERFIAERDGEHVGQMFLEKMWWVERPGGYYCGLSVVPEVWNQGIGSTLYDELVRRLRALNAERVYATIRQDRPISKAFADKRGFERTGHADRWSRLEVQSAHLDGYTDVEERLAMESITIRTLAELGPSDGLLRRIHAMRDEAIADIPMSEPYMGSPYEQFLEELRDPNLTPDRIWIAMDGDDPAGIAVLTVETDNSAFNEFTGVKRAHRGRGVARALKYKTVRWAAENGIGYIYTANDVKNQRMLSINNSLGYQELPISEEIAKKL